MPPQCPAFRSYPYYVDAGGPSRRRALLLAVKGGLFRGNKAILKPGLLQGLCWHGGMSSCPPLPRRRAFVPASAAIGNICIPVIAILGIIASPHVLLWYPLYYLDLPIPQIRDDMCEPRPQAKTGMRRRADSYGHLHCNRNMNNVSIHVGARTQDSSSLRTSPARMGTPSAQSEG